MTEELDNLVLRMLRSIDENVARLADDMRDVKVRMTSLEENMAGLNRRMDRLEVRVERIELRLDLVDAQS